MHVLQGMALKSWGLLLVGTLLAPGFFCVKINVFGEDETGWPKTCKGFRQSPVNIETDKVRDVILPKLTMSGVNQSSVSVTIMNDHGHSVKVRPEFAKPVTLTGGIFGLQVFVFLQFHFHWGSNCHEGSEHAINGKKLPLEVHFVFVKQGMPANVALNTPGATAVLSVMYDVKNHKNKYLEPVVTALESKKLETPESALKSDVHVRLLDYLPAHLGTYYTYIGSLTTPPCTEITRFVIFREKRFLAYQQLKDFSMIKQKNGKPQTKNWRHLEPLNGRQVYRVLTI